MKKVRLGLVGCGAMMKTHVKGVNELDNTEMVAVCDSVRERAEVVAESLGNNPEVFTDWREMVDSVDAVLIALPHDLHYECGMFFARHKKHVLMEKPLANTEEECLRLIKACEEEGVTLMCAYPVRYAPGYIKMKEFIDSGEYGTPFQASMWTEQLTCANVKIGEGSYALNRPEWSVTSRLGGGQLFSHGCHYIDLFLWYFGNPVSGSHVGTNLGTPWMLREGSSMVTMKFENGVIAYHGGTWGARGTHLGYDFQIHTDKGLLEYDYDAGIIKFYQNLTEHNPAETIENRDYEILWEKNRASLNPKDTQYEINHFSDCILNGKLPRTHGKNALQSLRVIWKLYQAEENGTLADLRGLGFENA